MKKRFRIQPERRIGFFQRNARSRVLGELLRASGYEVHFPTDELAGNVDLWIACLTNPVEAEAASMKRSSQPQTPLLGLVSQASRDTFERFKGYRAHELITLNQPNSLGEVVDAVCEILGEAETQGSRFEGPASYQRTYEADETGTNNSAYELAAFLTEREVAHAHRIRIVSAVFEATDNARRHAYGEKSGTFSIEVEIQRTRVHVCVIDHGHGFDAGRVQTDSVPAALPTRSTERHEPRSNSNGLLRLAALSEEHDVQSDEQGTRIEMIFELTPVRFEEEADDFAEVDFLDPDRARQLVQALQEGSENIGDIAPALALTVGRLLGGAQRGF